MADKVIGVVGAGIVGLAVARELTRRRPGVRVVVFEKEDRVAAHQTSHNSGVVHAGIYYVPGSLKARLCTRGVALLKEYCTEQALPYVECGKLVIAAQEHEVPRMDALYERAAANGVPGLRRIGPEEIREIEPHAIGLGAIHSPGSAITDYAAVARAFAAEAEAAGGEVRLGFPVDRIEPDGERVRVTSGETQVAVDELILCAGLQADRVAALAGDEPGPRVVPFRGEYLASRTRRPTSCAASSTPSPNPATPSSASTSPAAPTAPSRSAPTPSSPSLPRATAGATSAPPTSPASPPGPEPGGWPPGTGGWAPTRSTARSPSAPT
jgi:L-2-hydroxyglutarate oxidase